MAYCYGSLIADIFLIMQTADTCKAGFSIYIAWIWHFLATEITFFLAKIT